MVCGWGFLFHCLSDSSGNKNGTLHGHIYDKNNHLLSTGLLALTPDAFPVCDEDATSYNAFNINKDGTYSTNFHSQIYNLNTIVICKKDTCNYGGVTIYNGCIAFKNIAPLNFSFYPDSILQMDIHLLEDITDIKSAPAKPNDLLKIYPNPLNSSLLHYKIELPVKSTHCSVDLINLKGQQLQHYNITENSGQLQLPSNLPDSKYFLRLWMAEKVSTVLDLIIDTH